MPRKYGQLDNGASATPKPGTTTSTYPPKKIDETGLPYVYRYPKRAKAAMDKQRIADNSTKKKTQTNAPRWGEFPKPKMKK